jgi:hypothetical protein
MRILSLDVGVVHLAYCVIEKINDNFEIIDWNIINLNDNILKCGHILRTGRKCDKNAYYKIESLNLCLCKVHSKSYNKKINKKKIEQNINNQIIENRKNNCCHVIKGKESECCKKSFASIYDNYYCKLHLNMYVKNKIKTYLPKKIAKSKNGSKNINQLAETLFKEFDRICFDDIDEVLIENQPVYKNPVMKSIQMMIFSYFIMRGKIDNDSIKNVKLINAIKKLSITKNKISKEDLKIYDNRKGLGEICCNIIAGDDINKINKFKKKDDLCDSFIQGYFYLFPVIPNDIYDKLVLGLEKFNKNVKKNKKLEKEEKSEESESEEESEEESESEESESEEGSEESESEEESEESEE